MNDIQYIGEHLGPRILGQFGLLTAFVCALLGLFSFYLSTRLRDEVLRAHRWRKLGRISFGLHALGLLVLIGSIIFAMLNQYYEYQYVQAHVSAELPKSLIFSAFWEGQEGSFLLWLFWHAVLGFVLMGTAKKWETPVMAVLCSAQVILTSMILGIYLGFGEHIIRLGSNPILLLREVIDAPIFNQQDYVELLSGSGLNPALQNYWMTIHPPTLFLGFASTIVPFAFAISGLWVGKHKEWLKPALKWALFSGGILGIGILMGGAWAYEALNFGGYWAWDPVENTSLVPWLLLVAGIHTNLIARATGHAIRSTYVFYLLTFLLVIYSTYLTRSGALGDTSVHAFTEMGLEPQLLFFLFGYLLLSIAMVAWRWNKIPTPQKVETTSSKEFWMFMGSMVLLLSVILISGVTSLPVVNKIAQAFDPGWADRSILDPEELHNKLQLPIAVIIATLTALAQWLRWRAESIQTHIKPFAIHQAIGIGGALFMSWLTLQWIEAPTWQLSAMLFAAWYAVIVNVDYMIAFIRKDAKVAGSSLSHIGFGLMLVGILATSVNKRILSRNDFAMEGLNLDEELSRTTLRLTMDQPAIMEDYRLTLRRDTIEDFTRTYFVDYERFDRSTGDLVETFELKPTVLYAKDFSDIVVT
ncbi:MAG: cytochrome c biogenesis protein CcsA, partial [Bacteroidota bacterium]